MRLIDRYLGAEVIRNTLLALTVLLGLFSFIEFVEETDSVNANYSLFDALVHIVLTMPGRAFAMFPPAALIGTLLGLGRLAASREIVVLRAAGVSVNRITLGVMKSGAILVLSALIVGEFVSPQSEQIALERRNTALQQSLSMTTRFGSWLRDGRSFINIRGVLPDGQLEDVYIYDFDDGFRMRTATHAERARHGGERWLLEGIVQSAVSAGGVHTRHLERAEWESELSPDLVKFTAVQPESLSALGLARYLDYLRANGLSTARFELAFWNKMVYPVATAVMIYLACAMVLGRSSPMTAGLRVVIGALVGVGFHILHNMSVRVGLVYELSPLLTAMLPTLLFLAVGALLIRRAQ